MQGIPKRSVIRVARPIIKRTESLVLIIDNNAIRYSTLKFAVISFIPDFSNTVFAADSVLSAAFL